MLALFVHPLMALPGVLFLISMRFPSRIGGAGAVTGILSCLVLAFAEPPEYPQLTMCCPSWIPHGWKSFASDLNFCSYSCGLFRDWEVTARPFACLAVAWMTLNDSRVRKMAASAMLIGATGLLIAGIASLAGPLCYYRVKHGAGCGLRLSPSLVLLVPTLRVVYGTRTTHLGTAMCRIIGCRMVLFRRHWVRFSQGLALIVWMLREGPALAVGTGQVLRRRRGVCSSSFVDDRGQQDGPRNLTRSRRTPCAVLDQHQGGAWIESMVCRVCLVSMVLV